MCIRDSDPAVHGGHGLHAIGAGNLADLTIMLKNRELDLVVLSQSDVTSEMEAVPLGMGP